MNASFFEINATFAVELAIFAVVLAVLSRFVIKPLQAAMARRQAEIDLSLDRARMVEELLATTEADYRATLDRARQEARRIIETAEGMAADRARHDSGDGATEELAATAARRAR